MRYRNQRYSRPTVRTITVKYAGPCTCCGATINAGELADYYPVGTIASRTTPAIAHMGGLDGNSSRCSGEIKRRNESGFVDIDRQFEDNCADICGR
jgi:hypothetical protein